MASVHVLVDGPVGVLEVAVDEPDSSWAQAWRGIAVLAHPHPLFGGTMDNKVLVTMMRALQALGYVCVRSQFRGVGQTQGVHDHGRGETEDLLTLVHWARVRYGTDLPVLLAGFSFGAYVQTHVHAALSEQGVALARMLLVGTATSRWQVLPVPEDAVLIHGAQDDTVPLSSVLAWAEPQNLPVWVLPGADHFFHGRLVVLKNMITRLLGRA